MMTVATILDPYGAYHVLSSKSPLKLCYKNRKEQQHHHTSLSSCNSERTLKRFILILLHGKVQQGFTSRYIKSQKLTAFCSLIWTFYWLSSGQRSIPVYFVLEHVVV